MIPKDPGERGRGVLTGASTVRNVRECSSCPRKKDTKNTEVTAIIRASFWHTTLVRIPLENNAVQNHARSRHRSRSRHAMARAAAPAGGMVVTMGRVQVRFTSGARPPSEALGGRSARWYVPVSRHAPLLAARMPAADRGHRTAGTLCES